MITCEELKKLINKIGYDVLDQSEDEDECLIDFKHPKVGEEELKDPVESLYFLSSVLYNKKTGRIETTVRAKVPLEYKQLFLDYCCEKDDDGCIQVCRPHVDMGNKIVSVEARFGEKPIEKFKRLLYEMK